MAKKIVTVGLQLNSDKIDSCQLWEKSSLLDWDIILFRPDIEFHSIEDYQGKPCLDDHASFLMKEKCNHWKRELSEAVSSGKTVFVFLSDYRECFVATGEKQYSGTGRNQRTTRMVDQFSNYQAIPFLVSVTETRGKSIKLVQGKADSFAQYWNDFSSRSEYCVLLDDPNILPCMVTTSGEKPVGCFFFSKSSKGKIVFLPNIDFDAEGFIETRDGKGYYTKEAKAFAGQLTQSLLEIDRSLGAEGETTPRPDWANDETYLMKREVELGSELLLAESEVEKAVQKKLAVKSELESAGLLRSLLFEKGKPLEGSILAALRILGFEAENVVDGESEFDVVFESSEGRLLGEAEGKDNAAIAITKLRQLSMNILEDLDRDEVATPAKGVLFGNGYRLTTPSEREVQFTAKCVSAATQSSTALVATSSLFNAAKYVSETEDTEYAGECRKLLLSGTGLIDFPAVPDRNIDNKNPVESHENAVSKPK